VEIASFRTRKLFSVGATIRKRANLDPTNIQLFKEVECTTLFSFPTSEIEERKIYQYWALITFVSLKRGPKYLKQAKPFARELLLPPYGLLARSTK
jgi:hypothetical protein